MRSWLLFLKNNLVKSQPLKIAFLVSAFLMVAVWLSPDLFQVPFTVNGRVFVASKPGDAAAILKDAGFRPGRGDLLDVDGKIIEEGVGLLPKISIDGKVACGQTIIKRDAIVEFSPPEDRTENTAITIDDIINVTEVFGRGEYTIVKKIGAPGKKEVVRGVTSGKIVSAKNLTESQPTIVTRSDKRPEKVVALTFDDGPHPPFTSQVVAILRDMYASATFFMIGEKAENHPDIVSEVHTGGFQIGNHSYTHAGLDQLTEEQIVQELDKGRNAVFPITQTEPSWLRPPYGAMSPLLDTIAGQKNYRLVRWNIDSRDWEAAGPEQIINTIAGAVEPDSIILLHDGGGNRTNTVLALPGIIQALRNENYAFVTLDQLNKN